MATNALQPKSRFLIIEFSNRGGSSSWRVTGIGQEGKQVRQNFTNLEAARAKHLELEMACLGRRGPEVLKMTSLTDQQMQFAEAAFLRLDRDEDILPPIEHWLTVGKHNRVNGVKRRDEAVDDFCSWLDGAPLREKARINLKSRARIFRSIVGDLELSSITPGWKARNGATVVINGWPSCSGWMRTPWRAVGSSSCVAKCSGNECVRRGRVGRGPKKNA